MPGRAVRALPRACPLARSGTTDRTLPAADRAGVEVHEVGNLVVADAATRELNADPIQIGGREAAQPHVDGLAEQMLAVLGDAAGTSAQHRIRGRRAVA